MNGVFPPGSYTQKTCFSTKRGQAPSRREGPDRRVGKKPSRWDVVGVHANSKNRSRADPAARGL